MCRWDGVFAEIADDAHAVATAHAVPDGEDLLDGRRGCAANRASLLEGTHAGERRTVASVRAIGDRRTTRARSPTEHHPVDLARQPAHADFIGPLALSHAARKVVFGMTWIGSCHGWGSATRTPVLRTSRTST